MQDVRGRSELERREVYVRLLEGQILSKHPALVGLVKQCLHNAARERPSAEEVLAGLRRMRLEVKGEYGGGPMNLDIIVRVKVAKEMKAKDTRIEELTLRPVIIIVGINCKLLMLLILSSQFSRFRYWRKRARAPLIIHF